MTQPGAIIGTLVIAHDITERKQAERKLRESEEKYRSLVETAEDGILLTDLSGKHLFVNNAYCSALGYEAEDLTNMEREKIVHPDDLPLLKEKMAELLERGTIATEYRVRHRDGRWMYQYTKSALVYGEDQKPYPFLSIVRDITEFKRAEQALKDSETRLKAS